MYKLIDEISMGPFGSDIKVECFTDSGVPLLNGANLSGIKLLEESFNYVSFEKSESLKKANAKRGDVIITHRGTLGQISYIPFDSKFEKYVISQSQFRVSLKEDLVDPVFFTYYFHTKEGQKRLLSFKNHVGVPALAQATTNFRELDFPLIPLNSQKRIASVLSSLDAKIELNNRINAELEAMAKTLYNYWFVQFDFPDTNGKPYKTSGGKMVWNEELKREIPERWEVKSLNNVVDLILDHRGKTPLKLGGDWSSDSKDIIALSAKHVKGGKLLNLDQANRVTKEMFEKWMPEKLIDGDILMTSEAPLGEFYFLLNFSDFCMSQRLFAIRAKQSKMIPIYLYYELSKGNGYSQIIGSQSGSTVFGIRQDELRKIKVLKPNLAIQTSFDEMAQPMLAKIRINDAENQHLSSLRDWLLPMLMNGQVTVAEAEKAVYQEEDELRVAAEPAVGLKRDIAKPSKQEAFLRKLMLASHIVYELCDEPTFGHTKLMKLLYLSEQVGNMALQTNYKKFAAGPFDGKTLTLIDQEYKKNKWFTLEKRSFTAHGQQREATIYKKTEKSFCYKKHFDNYFGQESDSINKLISLFRNEKTQLAEIVATLYFAWNELIAKKTIISESILIKAFYDFHKEKKKFTKEQILDGHRFMLEHGVHP